MRPREPGSGRRSRAISRPRTAALACLPACLARRRLAVRDTPVSLAMAVSVPCYPPPQKTGAACLTPEPTGSLRVHFPIWGSLSGVARSAGGRDRNEHPSRVGTVLADPGDGLVNSETAAIRPAPTAHPDRVRRACTTDGLGRPYVQSNVQPSGPANSVRAVRWRWSASVKSALSTSTALRPRRGAGGSSLASPAISPHQRAQHS